MKRLPNTVSTSGANAHADERRFLSGARVVNYACRQDERAADDEVCKVADEGRRCALDEKLHHDLEQLRRYTGDGAEVERAD